MISVQLYTSNNSETNTPTATAILLLNFMKREVWANHLEPFEVGLSMEPLFQQSQQVAAPQQTPEKKPRKMNKDNVKKKAVYMAQVHTSRPTKKNNWLPTDRRTDQLTSTIIESLRRLKIKYVSPSIDA